MWWRMRARRLRPPPLFHISLPHFRLYEVVSLHMRVLPYKYRTMVYMLLTLMRLCQLTGAGTRAARARSYSATPLLPLLPLLHLPPNAPPAAGPPAAQTLKGHPAVRGVRHRAWLCRGLRRCCGCKASQYNSQYNIVYTNIIKTKS